MDEIKGNFIQELLAKPIEIVVSGWILDRIPHAFENNRSSFIEWKHGLSEKINVDPSSIVITGSAALGISLNPYKNYRAFNKKSDIDVAVISDYHFNESWRYLRNLGSGIHRFNEPIKQSIKDHVSKYIYWGTIATDKILPLLPFGKKWGDALELMAKTEPTIGRTINVRIYKDFESLRSYQVNNLKSLRSQELERGINNV